MPKLDKRGERGWVYSRESDLPSGGKLFGPRRKRTIISLQSPTCYTALILPALSLRGALIAGTYHHRPQ